MTKPRTPGFFETRSVVFWFTIVLMAIGAS